MNCGLAAIKFFTPAALKAGSCSWSVRRNNAGRRRVGRCRRPHRRVLRASAEEEKHQGGVEEKLTAHSRQCRTRQFWEEKAMLKRVSLSRALVVRGLAAGLFATAAIAFTALSSTTARAEPKDIKWGTGPVG